MRWTAAGMLEGERQFRWIIGYRDLAKLALAVERELHRHQTKEALLHAGGRSSRRDCGTLVLEPATKLGQHAPLPVEPDDVVAREHGPPLRIRCVAWLGPGPVPFLAEVEPDEPPG